MRETPGAPPSPEWNICRQTGAQSQPTQRGAPHRQRKRPAWWVGPYLPYVPEIELASGSVDALLNIVASSMLTVTTFSMSIIVGAYGSATTSATPRSNTLLAADPAAQNAVSIFISSFLFSIVGIIGLSAGLYADQARVLLFVAALIDILLIAWALLRWVDHLNSFGRVSDIIARIEAVAAAVRQWIIDPG